MPAFKAFAGIIRNLIPLIPFFCQNSFGQMIHLPLAVFIRQCQYCCFSLLPDHTISNNAVHIRFAAPIITIKIPERCSFLDNQTVSRQMFRFKCCCLVQCIQPWSCCLARQCRHKINIDILKAYSSGRLIILCKLLRRMNTPQIFQFFIIHRLKSKT